MVGVLITGADGFVGKRLVYSLSPYFKVNRLVFNNKKTAKNTFFFSNYTDKIIEDAVKSSDIVIHLAAMLHGPKKRMHDANVNLTKRLVELSKKHKIKHFVYISSENVQQNLKDTYTLTKKEAEKQVKTFKNYTILRPTVIYGPGDKKYVSRLIKIVKRCPIVPILGNGKNKFQFIYIDDVTNIIKSSIKNRIHGTYVIAGPESISYNDFMGIITKTIALKRMFIKIPLFVLRPISYILNIMLPNPPLTPGQVNNLSKDRDYNIKNQVKLFKYKPTTLKEGLTKLIKEDFK